MRNCGKTRGRVWLTAIAVALAVCAPAAQTQTVKARFDAAAEKDEQVRIQLTNMQSAVPMPELMKQVSQVVTSFESLVRRFPASGYADNALWHAASLADTAYQRFNRPEDRDRAVKLYRWLIQEYPASSLVKQANSKLAVLAKASIPTVTPLPVAVQPASAVALVPPAALSVRDPGPATLISIQRVVLPDSVRVTLELDREVTYREERIPGPSRLFFDLKNVQLTPALMDKVLSYSSDVVNKIRVGRHPGNTVRVVLDFEQVSKYSVFTLYSPFRLIIDAERAMSAGGLSRAASTASSTSAPSVARSAVAPPPAVQPSPMEIRESALAPPTPEVPVAGAIHNTAPSAPPPAVASVPAAPAAPTANVAGGFSIARQLGLSVSRIVIDPGHGGHDPGTMARGLTEATVTLDVALRLEKLLQKEPGIEVVLTRRTDVYVPLEERTAIANRHNADLFLSIHANSSRNSDARGIETYFLSFASSPEAEAVAARENSASEREMHQLPDLIKAITLNNKLDESRDLANIVQDSLVSTLKKSNRDVRSRGVKKAPFVVLIGAAMPSVLAEISFLTNRQEHSLLKTAAYKDRIAQALHAAVVKYRRSLKQHSTLTIER